MTMNTILSSSLSLRSSDYARSSYYRYCTVKIILLSVVPPALVTAIGPLVAPTGTVAAMKCTLSTCREALTPLKVTLVVPMN